MAFVTEDGEAVPLKRNYYYRILVSTDNTGYINFEIQVADWEDDYEFVVSVEDIEGGVDEDKTTDNTVSEDS